MLRKIINVLICVIMIFNTCYVSKAKSLNKQIDKEVFSDEFGDYYEDKDFFISTQKKMINI